MGVSKNAINGVTRREFLAMTAMAAAGVAVGCATNPVTGKSQLMLISEEEEMPVDRQNAPHQFSADYGHSRTRP